MCSRECFSSLRINIVNGRELCAFVACQHAGMNPGDVTRAHDADSDLSHLCLRNDSLGRGMCVTRELEWVAFPVLRPEDLDARDFVVSDLSECPDHMLQRQDSEPRQQSMTIFELRAWEIFGVVDVEDLNQIRIEILDH